LQAYLAVAGLMSSLREQGVDDVTRVKTAYFEPDGKISVVTDEYSGQ